MFGLLNIHKPAGITSRDVVNRVQGMVRPLKTGHAGTLDPLATGVLIVCVGQATRLIEYVQQMPKRYVGTFLLGRESETEDVEGAVVEIANAPQPSRQEIEAALPKFVGEISQVPPAFSALKVAGKRAYALARKGEAVELVARPTTIYTLQMVRYDYPELVLDVRCGSGTYVRSLGRDIARALGTQAVMSALVREEIGPYHLAEALPYAEISPEAMRQHLQPALSAVAALPRVPLTEVDVQQLVNGRQIPNRLGIDGEEIAGIDERGELTAILQSVAPAMLQPVRFFPRPPINA